MKIVALVFAFMILLSFVHADVGPPPPHPSVTVTLQKNGMPDTRISEIVYHCMGANASDNGAVSARLATFGCSGGVCSSNSGWFYKFNPCYDFPEGYFSYEINNQTIKTDYFNNTQSFGAQAQTYGTYDIAVDSESGVIKSINGSDYPLTDKICLSLFMLPVLLAAAGFFSEKSKG